MRKVLSGFRCRLGLLLRQQQLVIMDHLTNDTRGSSSQILKRLDAIKKRYKDTLAARKKLSESPLMKGSPLVSLTPLPEPESAQKHSTSKPRGRVHELQASGLSPPPPLHMTFSPGLPQVPQRIGSSGKRQPQSQRVAAHTTISSPFTRKVKNSPLPSQQQHNNTNGLRTTTPSSVMVVERDAGSGRRETSSSSKTSSKLAFHFNSALLDLLRVFSTDSHDDERSRGGPPASFSTEPGSDSLSILKNLDSSIRSVLNKNSALRTEVAELKDAAVKTSAELKAAREGSISASDIRKIVQEELCVERKSMLQELETRFFNLLAHQRNQNQAQPPIQTQQSHDHQQQQRPSVVEGAGDRQQIAAAPYHHHFPAPSSRESHNFPQNVAHNHRIVSPQGTGPHKTASPPSFPYGRAAAPVSRAWPSTPTVKPVAASPNGNGNGSSFGDQAVRDWQESLTLRRCVSLLHHVGWDDPERLAALTGLQFQGVLSQIGMVPSQTINQANVVAALSAHRR